MNENDTEPAHSSASDPWTSGGAGVDENDTEPAPSSASDPWTSGGAGVDENDTEPAHSSASDPWTSGGAGVDANDRGITRRAALALLGGGAAAVLVGGTVALKARDDVDDATTNTTSPPPDPLPDSDARLEGIAEVGARYRELVPDEATQAALLAAIPMAEELPDTPGALEEELGARRDQIRAEFGSGDVVDVDGWQLSRTEARLAALISLES